MTRYRGVLLGAFGAALTLVTATCHDESRSSAPTAPVPPPSQAVTTGAGPVVLVGAGDIATCGNNNDEATAKILDTIPGMVMTLGDEAADGSATTFNNCYNPTWGRHKARTQPTPGDKEYLSAGAAGDFGYFGAVAGGPAERHYHLQVCSWAHLVVHRDHHPGATHPRFPPG